MRDAGHPLLKRVFSAIITVGLPVLMTLAGIRLLMFEQFMQFEYQRPGFPEDSYGFTIEDRLAYSPHALRYIFSDDDLSYFDDLRLPPAKCFPPGNTRDCPLYNQRELGHLHDVKVVVNTVFSAGIMLAMAMICSALALWFLEFPRRTLQRSVLHGSILTLTGLLTIVTLAVGAWTVFFDTFHALFFEAGTWQFYFSDTLIRLYPQQFWFDASITTGIVVTISAALLFIAAWQWGQAQLMITDRKSDH